MALIVQEGVSLRPFNTFGIDVKARFFVEIEYEAQLEELFAIEKWRTLPRIILGGGSNVLFTEDFPGLIIWIAIKGIRHEVDKHRVHIWAGAGELWNDLVSYCVKNQFSGIENLSLIPGTVGAAPVQNIGAYGVELEDVFHSLRAFDTQTLRFVSFLKKDCEFSYRESIFKSAQKGRYIIVSVQLTLSLEQNLRLDYGAIRAELLAQNIESPTIEDVSRIVSKIRVEKLPDPSTIGNSGSFFKNPIIEEQYSNELRLKYPDLVCYPAGKGRVKLAAGWMIEKCGWKGVQEGRTGTWKNQALVIVNHGGATGAEIFAFSEKIIESVRDAFGIVLEREVNVH